MYVDREGLETLIARLQLMLKKTDHIHLMTEEWGIDGDLSGQLQGERVSLFQTVFQSSISDKPRGFTITLPV